MESEDYALALQCWLENSLSCTLQMVIPYIQNQQNHFSEL